MISKDTLNLHLQILHANVAPIIAITLIGAAIIWITYKLAVRPKGVGDGVFIVVFSLLGAITGVVTGNSREPTVSALLPAILALVTAVVGYAFTKESAARMRPVLPYCLLGLMISSFYGLCFGAKVHYLYDTLVAVPEETKRKKELLHYEKVDLEVEKAQILKDRQLSTPVKQ